MSIRKNFGRLALWSSIGFIALSACTSENQEKPNILWVSAEDMTTLLGCYGDERAATPNLDAFAKKSILFSNAFSTAPVCSPSRSAIVSGYYATTLGTQHLRAETSIPALIKPFPKSLRETGYYATNNFKEDYNFIDTSIWDDSSKKAHWRNREKGQPFFSVFNLMLTHQSSIFGDDSTYHARVGEFLPFVKQCDPATLKLPSYYPDSPEIRALWARYYTNVSIIDYQFGQILKELEDDGLSDNTIVVFFSDHGTGIPRSKRALYDSGLKVPLLIHVPSKFADRFNFKGGTVDHRLVTLLDLAPTLLEIGGVDAPEAWRGNALISNTALTAEPYVFAASDRVDEAYELSRTIRTSNYRYVRNFFPYLPLLQPNFYTDQSEIMKALEQAKKTGGLSGAQRTMFAQRREPEELYDVVNDPDETINLANDPACRDTLMQMRTWLAAEIAETFDTGLMPEPEMIRLSTNSTPFETARRKDILPIDEILGVCDLVLDENTDDMALLHGLRHSNGLVRYWAAVAVQACGATGQDIRAEIARMLADDFPTVRIEASKALIKMGDQAAVSTLLHGIDSDDLPLALYASRSFQQIAELIPEVPPGIFEKYQVLAKETNNGDLNSNFYKLYSFWALKETLRK